MPLVADDRQFGPAGLVDQDRHGAVRRARRRREVLGVLASTSRALEVNTQRAAASAEIVRRWHEAGGDTIAFRSDAHDPAALARDFPAAAAMVQAHGFRPGCKPYDLWRRA